MCWATDHMCRSYKNSWKCRLCAQCEFPLFNNLTVVLSMMLSCMVHYDCLCHVIFIVCEIVNDLCTHTHTHKHTHARTHARTSTRTHAQAHGGGGGGGEFILELHN